MALGWVPMGLKIWQQGGNNSVNSNSPLLSFPAPWGSKFLAYNEHPNFHQLIVGEMVQVTCEKILHLNISDSQRSSITVVLAMVFSSIIYLYGGEGIIHTSTHSISTFQTFKKEQPTRPLNKREQPAIYMQIQLNVHRRSGFLRDA